MSHAMEAPKMGRRQTLLGNHPVASSESMLEMYEPGDVIGSGSFGIIRKVRRKTDGLILARKELNYRKMDERDLKQLNEEVHILQNMPPNDYIVRYYERFLDKNNCTLHIVMEFCEGGDLTNVISRCRQDNVLLPEDVVWSYLTQIALALADCHAEVDSNGKRKAVVLHRDIKPENVFLSRDNVVKLGDFGLSKAMALAAFTNTFVGTPYYMSPELIHGQQYDAKSDIWALGCLIHELCAWRPPFHQAQSQPELAKLIREGRIPSLPQGYSTALNQVVRSMLRQDLTQRPSAKQILQHEQCKFQIKGIKLRRVHDTLIKERDALKVRELQLRQREQAFAVREAALLDRERMLAMREERVTLDKNALDDEKERLVQALAGSSLTSSSSTTDTKSETDSLFDEHEDEARHQFSSGSSIGSEQGDLLKKMASRPSLVPRRGLMDSRHSISQLTRRLSSNSLMSLDDTPHRNSPGRFQQQYSNPPTVTFSSNTNTYPSNNPDSAIRKRITTSKSMYNLNAGIKSGATKQLFPSQSRDSLRSFAQAQGQNNGALQPSSNNLEPGFMGAARRLVRTASASPLVGRHTSLLAPASPTKRTAAIAFASSPSESMSSLSPTFSETPTVASTVSSSGGSNAVATANIAPKSSPAQKRTTAPPALPPAPMYNLDDEDSLPSPFLRKKASTTNIVTRSSAAAARGTAPPVPSRTLRPSTSRLTLAHKLAGRNKSSFDEQGVLTNKKNVVASTIS